MKKTIKIIAIVVAGVVGFVFLVLVGLYNVGKQSEKILGDVIPQNEPQASYEYRGNPRLEEKEENIPDSSYYGTIQEALLNCDAAFEEEETYQRQMDEIIKTFENEKYIVVYYRAIKNSKEECLALIKFKKKEIEGEIKYTFVIMEPVTMKKNAGFVGTDLGLIQDILKLSDFFQDLNIDPKNTRFLYGISRTKEIYNLKVEGQSPSGIVPFKVFEKTYYFWYYENLESKKLASELNAEFKK